MRDRETIQGRLADQADLATFRDKWFLMIPDKNRCLGITAHESYDAAQAALVAYCRNNWTGGEDGEPWQDDTDFSDEEIVEKCFEIWWWSYYYLESGEALLAASAV